MDNKDFIEDIKAKLKAADELPYREGAWERFGVQQGEGSNTKVLLFKRLASIAAVGIAVLGVSLYFYTAQNSSLPNQGTIVKVGKNSPSNSVIENKSENPFNSPDKFDETGWNGKTISKGTLIARQDQENIQLSTIDINSVHPSDIVIKNESSLIVANLKPVVSIVKPIIHTSQEHRLAAQVNPNIQTLAHQTVNDNYNNSEVKLNKSSKMSLGDKLQLGLYVSPSRTSEKFDIGAGFMVSYALTNKISLRTGTSYNSYTVGVVKDPMQMASAEVVDMQQSYNNSLIAVDQTSAFRQEMILPNINAVMGKVEALEIPLEISYALNKGFYTSAGVSYSVIINQQREAQYVENVGMMSLKDDASLIPSAVEGMNKVKTKTVQSNQDNVNPNGFNGFANFSIGKKVNIKNKMSMSLEPFVKIPLGEFRKSDLNYTNSGIRIITTF
ncbi:hypothetical protein [Sphingobacterium bovistauri]|uniref:Outer membrane protein beta-barrel domain-containing protein n=1 Tax=Sphingobacterium bovistauri TaxID=2781959 RepID=A0ABS7Z7S5_9SPHI|nr:hypothetical protein [Sphingobacterium bovistauri]MCA5004915.1 hypothetical protein [Sphingobacterium bovistauri]